MSRVGEARAQKANETITDFYGRRWKASVAKDVFSPCKACEGSGKRKYKGLVIANKVEGIDMDSDCPDCNGLGKCMESRKTIRRTRV